MSLRKKSFVGCFVLIAMSLMILSSGCSEEPKEEKDGAKFYPTKKPSAVAGEAIYVSECEKCHGVTGAGDGPEAADLKVKPSKFTDLDFMRRETPEKFYEAILEGKEGMPGYEKKLNEKQRFDVLFYVWSFATTKTQIDEGKNTYFEYCKGCHGEKGDGKGKAKRSLAKKLQDFTDPRFMMKEDSDQFFSMVTQGKKAMPAFFKKLTADQRWDVINYIWTFVYTVDK